MSQRHKIGRRNSRTPLTEERFLQGEIAHISLSNAFLRSQFIELYHQLNSSGFDIEDVRDFVAKTLDQVMRLQNPAVK